MVTGSIEEGDILFWTPLEWRGEESLLVCESEYDETGVRWWNLQNERCRFPLPEHRIRSICRRPNSVHAPVQIQDASDTDKRNPHYPPSPYMPFTQMSLFSSF